MKKKPLIPTEMTYTGPAAEARIVELGLSWAIVRRAVVAGEMQRDNCSPFDPPTFPGISGWAGRNRELRVQVLELDWSMSNTANFCTVISPDGEWAIATSTGDDGTGVTAKDSNFKNRRGPRTRRAVEQNQALLFSELKKEAPNLVLSKTWMLLVHRKGDYAFCEMKLPRLLDEDGRVAAWAERVIFPPINLGDEPGTKRRHDEPLIEGGATEIDIDITRRKAQ